MITEIKFSLQKRSYLSWTQMGFNKIRNMTKYISIRQVLDNLMDNPLLQDLSLERAVNYAVRFIQ